MPSESGVAANHIDLLSRLTTFLTTNSQLVASSQQWTLLRTENLSPTDTRRYFRAPGLAGTDEIYVNVRAYSDPSGISYFNWDLRAATGFSENLAFGAQPGTSPSGPRKTMINGQMNYWFVANGRRFITVADANGTWASSYGGFYLPFGTPSEDPYPMFVGANTYSETIGSTVGDFRNGSFWDGPGSSTSLNSSGSSSYLRSNNGSWVPFANFTTQTSRTPSTASNTYPWATYFRYASNNDISVRTPGDFYPIQDGILYSSEGGGDVYGRFDGVGYIPGEGLSPGDTINSGQHLVIRNGIRQNPAYEYAAIDLT